MSAHKNAPAQKRHGEHKINRQTVINATVVWTCSYGRKKTCQKLL